MIQNTAAQLVFNKPKSAHVTPLFIYQHWLPVAVHMKFKTLMLPYRTATCSEAPYFTHSYDRHINSLFTKFSFTIPSWWNNLPTPIWNAKSQTTFMQPLKTHLVRHHLTASFKKNKKNKIRLIWTMSETLYYQHFLCLFASLWLIACCIPQL